MDERDLDEALRRMSQTKVSRRGFLAAAGLGGTAAALAACTGSTASSAAPTASTGAVASAAASAAPAASPAASYELESELLTYNWSEYVSEKNKAEFTARTGVAYSEDIFSNNEELVAKLP